MVFSKGAPHVFRRTQRVERLATHLVLVAGLCGLPLPAEGAGQDYEALSLSPPYVTEHFGAPIFFPSYRRDEAEILTPGRKHIEIDKSAQRLRAYDNNGLQVLEADVSTGKPGMDEQGRQRSETHTGIHRVIEARTSRRWSKDPRVKMLDWIGMIPGVEKGIHGLEPVGEFASYEKLLGQKASHGCIRLSRKHSRWLREWIGEEWKTYPLIVYIYDEPIRERISPKESRYLLLLILQEGLYTYIPHSQERAPFVQRDETVNGVQMKPGNFLLYQKEAETWRLVRSSNTGLLP